MSEKNNQVDGGIDEEIDELLLATYTEHKEQHADQYIDHYLEQYRIYLHIFNDTSNRRQKSNEFFLGLNTAIIALMGYIETKDVPHSTLIFTLVPLVGIAICYCWYRMLLTYSQLNRAKFKVIHTLERKLPANLFESEWHLLGEGKDHKKYFPFSHIEKYIPLTFILLYIVIFLASSPLLKFFGF